MADEIGGGISKERRIQQRQQRVNKLTTDSLAASNNQPDAKSGVQQAAESIARLERRKKKGLLDVSEVRVVSDAAETKRRIEDDRFRQHRLNKLQSEAISSAKANASIESKWVDLLAKEIPHELEQEIRMQQQNCNAIIKSKDDLITEFLRELRGKDEEYILTLKKQSEEVEALMESIRREYEDLQREYVSELDAIEVAYHEERDKLIDAHKKDIAALFETRKSNEDKYRDMKLKRDEANVKEIEELITRGADQYSRLNIELETNIQTLKQQFEDIKATYQLNTEKLDYNYRVLTELDIEKTAELMRYKRRQTKLKDQLSKVVSDFSRLEKSDKKENAELTEDYRRLTNKYKDLQAKFRHFETADTLKYNEVWAMHEEEAKNLADQLLRADKVITSQHLGYLWTAPDMAALQSTLENVRSGNVTWKPDGAPVVISANDLLVVDDAKANIFDDDNFDGDKERKRMVQGVRIRAVLRMLAQEVGFLVDPAVMEAIESMPDKDAELEKAETLLKALGVKTEARMAKLMKYFFHEETAAASPLDGTTALEEEEAREVKVKPTDEMLLFNTPEEVLQLRSMISAEEVVNAVKTFIDDVSDVSAVGGRTVDDAGKGAEDVNRIRQRRLAGMKLYWSYLSQMVGDESIGVWKQLEKDSKRVKEALASRAKCIEQVDQATQRNIELKALLNQYLGDERNALFQIPPAQTMRIRDVRVPGSSGKMSGSLMSPSMTGESRRVMRQSEINLAKTNRGLVSNAK